MILKDSFTTYRNFKAKITAKEDKIKLLEKQIRKLNNYPGASWVVAILHPLAIALAEATGRAKWEVMGPFGLGCETNIWLYDTEEERNGCNMDSITLRPDIFPDSEGNINPFGVLVKDYGNKNNSYSDGSIGERNGFNYSSIQPPADADLQWFIDRIQIAEKETLKVS